jgi:hypothetical protein
LDSYTRGITRACSTEFPNGPPERSPPMSDASNAERAAEHFAREVLGCVQTRRAVRTRFQKVDFFGCDLMGRREDGSSVWIQVTASREGSAGKNSGNVWSRKRKIETVPWREDDTVLMLEMVREKNGRSWDYHFRGQQLREHAMWFQKEPIPVPKRWFKAWRD